MRMDRHLLTWGAFFVISGAIPLAVRTSIIPAAVLGEWVALWPLLLVGPGLRLVLADTRLHPIGSLVSVLTAGIMAGGLLVTGFHGIPLAGVCGSGSTTVPFAATGGAVGDRTTFEVEVSCGSFDVRTSGPGSPTDGVAWSLAGTSPLGRSPTVESSSDHVRIAGDPHRSVSFEMGRSTFDLVVPRAPDVDIAMTLNAADSSIDLTGARVRNLSFTLNAGSIRGDLSQSTGVAVVNGTVNAGSAVVLLPLGTTALGFTINAGSVTLCVPTTAALDVSWSGALASNNFSDAGLVPDGDDHWTSAGTSGSGTPSRLDVSANAGSFTLLIGETCDA